MEEEFRPQYVEIPIGSGGPRPGAGRRPVADKKQQHYVMVYTSVVEKLGGKEGIRKILEKAIEDELAKKLLEEGQ